MNRTVSSRFRALFAPSNRGGRFEQEEPHHRGAVVTFCVFAACVLWFAFSMQETYTQVIELPTEVQNLPADQALVVELPTSVRVQVEGEGVQILRLYYNPPTIPIDASGGDVDLFLIAPEIVNNVSLQTVTPRQIRVPLEDRVTKTVPVVPNVTVQYAPGHQMVGPMSVYPDSIRISGAQSIVAGIQEWQTEARNLGSLADSLNAIIALSDTLSGLVDLEVSEVNVRGDIQEFTEARRSVRVRLTGAREGQTVSFVPETVEVIYQIPLSQYDASMDAEDFYAFVPYSDILRDELGRVYPMVHAPQDLIVPQARVEPTFLGYYETQNE